MNSYFFLNGLYAEFEKVRREIHRMDPCLDIEHTYAYVCREANRQTLLNDDQSISDSVAMLEC